MAKHIVKCPKCGKSFDTNIEQAVKVSARRYGHATCYPDIKDFVPLAAPQEDPDLTKLKEYIGQLFGKNANWAQINRQIKIYITDNHYSYSGILKSLVYFYGIKGNSIEKANGALGIVPFIYQDAYNYYYDLFLAQSRNEQKDFSEIGNKTIEITIAPPKRPIKKRFFKFLDEGDINKNE